jgi:hypothetical protein
MPFGTQLGTEFVTKMPHNGFVCTGTDVGMHHEPEAVMSVYVVENRNPVGYICTHCGATWTVQKGDPVLNKKVKDPVEPKEREPIRHGVAFQRALQRRMEGKWVGKHPQ